MKKHNKHVGSSLDELLKEEGILGEARAIVIEEAVAWREPALPEQHGEDLLLPR